MTEQPQRTQLSPDEWKQLCLLNVNQLLTHLQNLPAVLEGGTSAMTVEQMSAIETHLARGKTFLTAWARSKPVQAQEVVPTTRDAIPASAIRLEGESANGAAPVKRRGGWPAGKPRKPKTAQEVA